jgi:hypothetical protein
MAVENLQQRTTELMTGLGTLESQGTGSGSPVSALGLVSVGLKDQFGTDISSSQMAAFQLLTGVPQNIWTNIATESTTDE